MLWAKENSIGFAIQNLRQDIAANNSDLRFVYEEAARETAQYIVNTQSVIDSQSGRLLSALANSYTVNWPISVNLADPDKLDALVGPYRLSDDNSQRPDYKYRIQGGYLRVNSYWPFVLFGWSGAGGKGGKRGYRYKLVANWHNPITGEYVALSPYHPSILNGELRPTSYTRHPGAKSRNIFALYSGQAQKFFNKILNKKLLLYFAKYGIKR